MTSQDRERIQRAISTGQFDLGLSISQDVLQKTPGDPEARRMMALIHHRSGSSLLAAEIYHALTEENSNSVEDWRGLAIARKALSDLPGTYEASKRVVELTPNDPLALNALGLCAYHMNQGDEALAYFDKAISLQPLVPALHRNRGIVLVGISRHAEAEAAFLRALELDPNDFPSLVQLSSLHLRHERPADSRTYSRRAIGLRPVDPEANFYLARALVQLDEPEQARKHFELASRSDPRFLTPYAIWMIEEGKVDEAKDVLVRRLEIDPLDGLALYYSIEIGKVGATSEQVQRLKLIASDVNHPPDSQAFANYALGKYWERQKEFSMAFAAYQKANDRFFGLKLRHMNDLVGNIDQEVHDNKAKFTQSFILDLRKTGSSDYRPIFIIGMIRSGTTLLEQVVSAHSQVSGAGELRYWMENGPYAFQNPGRLADFARGYSALIDRLLPGALRVTDKMPLNIRFLGLIASAFPKAKFLWTRRDPMDTCFSVYATPFTDPPIFSYNLRNIGYVYRKYEELMAHWLEVLPSGTIHEVRYESLVADQESTTRAILEYLELPFEEACLSPEKNQSAVRTPSSLQVRNPVYRTSVQRYKNFEPWLDELKEGLGGHKNPEGL
jgi:tetratricopeptide (TPR) repeat protein